MKFSIDEQLCLKSGLTTEEVLMFLIIKSGANIPQLLKEMQDKDMVRYDSANKEASVNRTWDDIVTTIILSGDPQIPEDAELELIAKELIDLFPIGKKAGTNVYWRGNVKDIKLRLKKFFKLYGKNYTKEQIITATKRYIESFKGQYDYMKVSKYFIWKDARKIDSEGKIYVEEVSELATYIENEDVNPNENWTSEVR